MKSNIQLLQSRISKRRNAISKNDWCIRNLLRMPKSIITRLTLKRYRETSRELGHEQQLDKRLFQMLLAKERDKYAGYFRSSHPHWMAVTGFERFAWC